MGKKTEFVLKSVKGLLWAEILLLFSSLLNAQEGRIYTNTTSIQLVSYCNDPAKSDDLPLHCSVPVSASTITLAKLDQYPVRRACDGRVPSCTSGNVLLARGGWLGA